MHSWLDPRPSGMVGWHRKEDRVPLTSFDFPKSCQGTNPSTDGITQSLPGHLLRALEGHEAMKFWRDIHI